jgi:hypothetical protein
MHDHKLLGIWATQKRNKNMNKGEEEMDEGQGNDQNNGAGNKHRPPTGEAQSSVPTAGVKRKDNGKEP